MFLATFDSCSVGNQVKGAPFGQQNVRNINQLEDRFPFSRLFVHMLLCDEAFILYTVFFTVLVGEDFDFNHIASP